MKEQLITFDTAKLAKEKGFEWKTLKAYDVVPMVCSYSKTVFEPLNYNSKSGGNYHSAPTQSLLQKWLRDVHNIEILIKPQQNIGEGKVYTVLIGTFYLSDTSLGYIFTPNIPHFFKVGYEEALEKGLQEAFKLLKKTKQ